MTQNQSTKKSATKKPAPKKSASKTSAPAMFAFQAGQGAVPTFGVAGPKPSKGSQVCVLGVFEPNGLETKPAQHGVLGSVAMRLQEEQGPELARQLAAVLALDPGLGKVGSVRTMLLADGTQAQAAGKVSKTKNQAKSPSQQPGGVLYVLVGLGKHDAGDLKALAKGVKAAASVCKGLALEKIWLSLNLEYPEAQAAQAAALCVRSWMAAYYRFEACTAPKTKPSLPHVELACSKSSETDVLQGLEQGRALGLGMQLTQDLGNLPGNICTPTYLAETAQRMAKQYRLGVDVLDAKAMEALGMYSLLSVGKGSANPPKLIVLKYQGAAVGKKTKADAAAPLVLVGKGITFDTGGISLKPGANMDEMKFDMCGAASVLGTLRAVAEMKLPVNLYVVIPTAENMPAGNASKPGDVVVSMSGQTIEILNTDAEGRLILCDALTYVERFKPAVVVDVATLTGACVVALGHVRSGLYSPQDDLAQELLAAGNTAQDTAWRMPLDEEYHEQLKSNFADMANIGGPPAGSVTAACFLQKYTKAYPWAHLDIAGTAWRSGKDKGATARPVPLLTQFVLNRALSSGKPKKP